ncbi:MAG TPA: DUF951 domain-containing protein [Chloroflexota bacterium]|nr:DUF951 domain-containing protein [Chloroflexota bacterium]
MRPVTASWRRHESDPRIGGTAISPVLPGHGWADCVNETPLDVRLDDVVRLRRPHACGGNEWTITRLGADIGLRCNQCSHRILLPRTQLAHRITSYVGRGPESSGADLQNLP